MCRWKAASAPRYASRPISRGWPITASASTDLRTAITGANVAGPKGALDGAHQSYTIATNDQIDSADAYRSVVVAYRNGAPVLIARRRRRDRRHGEFQDRRLVPGQARSHHRHPAPARRQRDPDRRAHQGRTAEAATRDPARRDADGGARPDRHDPGFRPRRAVHARAQRCSGGAGGVPVPAHDPRYNHRRRWRCRCRWSPPSA